MYHTGSGGMLRVDVPYREWRVDVPYREWRDVAG